MNTTNEIQRAYLAGFFDDESKLLRFHLQDKLEEIKASLKEGA